MIAIAATIAAALAVGVGAERRFEARAQEAARRGLRFMLYVLVPVVAFFNVARLELTVDVGVGIALGWLALLGAGAAAWAVGTRGLGLARPSVGSLICVAIQGNTAYLGYPLCAALLGADRLPEAVAYDALVQAPVLFLAGFGAGAAFGTRAGAGPRERLRTFVLRNPPLAAVVLGLLAPAALAPEGLVSLSHVLVTALLPLGFLAVGVNLSAGRRATAGGGVPPAALGAALALRLVLAPALLVVLAVGLIDLPAPYLLLAAMPAGINGLVIAEAYGLDLALSSAAIAWSTAVVVVVGLGALAVVG